MLTCSQEPQQPTLRESADDPTDRGVWVPPPEIKRMMQEVFGESPAVDKDQYRDPT